MKNLERLLNALSGKDFGAYILTSLSDIGWLTGFTGSSAYVVLSGSKPLFITDRRYELAVGELLTSEWDVEIVKNYGDVLAEQGKRFKRVTVQNDCTLAVSNVLSRLGAEVVVDGDTVPSLRAVKTPSEIEALKAQYALAAEAFLASLGDFKAGKSESEWAAILEYNMKMRGAQTPSFPTITASGHRGALPHGEPSGKIISEREPVVVDFGSKKLYTSDYTRLLYNGGGKAEKIAKIVEEAIDAAKRAVLPGVTAEDVDKAARNVISEYGYGDYFTHSTGHGVGVDVHENPVIRSDGGGIILENMVFTIEPGIYLPGEFGVRLEDTVLVTADGCENLSELDKYIYSF